MIMEIYKPSKKVNWALIITMLSFVVIGSIMLLIGFHSNVLSFLKKFGLVIMVLALPIALWLLYDLVIKKIKEM